MSKKNQLVYGRVSIEWADARPEAELREELSPWWALEPKWAIVTEGGISS